MTAAAREVLDDCRLALTMLEEETDLDRWRVHWAAAVALLRAVGHVLDKVDGEDADLRRLAAAAFRSWKGDAPEHEIFREFIEPERNTVLKEYRFRHHPLDEVSLATVLDIRDPETGDVTRASEIFQLGDNLYRPFQEGWRAGDDARDVLSDAINWWENQLNAIDTLSRNRPDAVTEPGGTLSRRRSTIRS